MPKTAPSASPEDIAQQIRRTVHGESATIQGSVLTAPAAESRTTVSQDILVKDIDPRGTNVRSRMDPGIIRLSNTILPILIIS